MMHRKKLAVAINPTIVKPLTRAQDRARDTLISDATHNALGGGSRSGKTYLLIRQIITRALKAPGSRHAIFRFRFNSLKSSVIRDTWPKVIREQFPQLQGRVHMDKTDWFATLPNGSEVWFGGLDDSERVEKILGMEFVTLYFNECSQIPYHSVTTAHSRLAQKVECIDGNIMKLKCFYDFNPPSKRHWTYVLFVLKRDPEDHQPRPEGSISFYLINPDDNLENISPEYMEFLDSLPEAKRNRFKYGRFADDSEDQLWREEVIAHNRMVGRDAAKVPQFSRVVIAIDPSGTKGKEEARSDEVGITVCALGIDGHGYLLEDLSGQFRPEDWGTIAAEAFKRHKADCIVGEVNYGGDMVRAVIQAKNSSLPFKEVHATRGKVIRAEPISALYVSHKIHHVGHFPELEDQLMAFTTSGYMGLRSPDRADSMIWGFTELFPGLVADERRLNIPAPQVRAAERSASRYDRKYRR